MSAWLIFACGLAYLYVAVEQARAGNWPMSLVFASYFTANLGLVAVALKT